MTTDDDNDDSFPYYKPKPLPLFRPDSKPHPSNCKCRPCKVLIPLDPTYVKPIDNRPRDEKGQFTKKPPREIPVHHYYDPGVEPKEGEEPPGRRYAPLNNITKI